MDSIEVQSASRKRRQGQTLAEFAITLPTLLILLFGIIEFGRIFQAWVSLQNSARTAARYASTDDYFQDQYPMNFIFSDTVKSDATGFIPCVDDSSYAGGADQRGTQTTVEPNGSGKGTVNIYTGGVESLFATWYDGRNCVPTDETDQDRRKDMARILSIMQEARRGAAGLALEDSQLSVPADKKNIQGNWNSFPWFQVWQNNPRPPRSDQRYWFNVVICSNRNFVYDSGDPKVKWSNAKFQQDTGSGMQPAAGRFINYQGDTDLTVNNTVVTPWSPACLLNEDPVLSYLPAGLYSNAGQEWLDPGAPENTVYITVTFNHPLITPLGIAPFVTLRAQRSAIVESFVSKGSRSGAATGPAIGSNAPTPLPTDTYTPKPPDTNTPTPSTTPKPTSTSTRVPDGPFDCAKISLTNKILVGNQFRIDIQNDNSATTTTYITRVQITWPNITSYAQFGLTQMSLNTVQNWFGSDPQNTAASTTTTDTSTKPGSPAFSASSTAIREVPPQDSSTYAATFSGPPLLTSFVSANQYAITITLDNPLTPASPCTLTSAATISTATPTVVGNPTATKTPTPDCASSLIGVKFNSFDVFGIVRYDIINQRNTTSTLVSVKINWQKYVNSQRLVKVSMMAPPGQPGSVVVWDSNNVNEDATPPTDSKTEGVWLTNYTIPAGAVGSPSITPIYFDFSGINRYDDYYASTNPRYGGSSDFNFSEFELTCGTPGGSSGPTGGQPTGKITPENYPTPTNVPTQGPTNTAKPTNTPAPTLTPSLTPTKGPNTATFTPKPPTATPPPTATTAPLGPPTQINANP